MTHEMFRERAERARTLTVQLRDIKLPADAMPYSVKKQYLSFYGFSDLFADFGGYLGLLSGHSVLPGVHSPNYS
jgi:hypothetical protein